MSVIPESVSVSFMRLQREQGDPYTILADTSYKKAMLFAIFTDAVGRHFRLPTGILEGLNGWGNLDVDETLFCALVEAVFARPDVLLTFWAQYAAGMYDVAKQKRHPWRWEVSQSHPINFRPTYVAVEAPPLLPVIYTRVPVLPVPEGPVEFITGRGQRVGIIEPVQASLFVSLAYVAAQDSGLTSGLSEIKSGRCVVEEGTFCQLVEVVVLQGTDLFDSWAEYAAGMYEAINGEWYAWAWAPPFSSTLGFAPVRLPGINPWKPSGRTIGWMKDVQIATALQSSEKGR
jgi:hypothetical protein